MAFILILASCTPTPLETPTPPASGSPHPSPTPSLAPSATATPTAQPTPTPLPTPIVVPTPVMPIPTPTVPLPTPTPDFSAKPLAIPAYTGSCAHEQGDDTGIINYTTITGKVVDEKNQGVEGVNIRIKSLVPCLSYGVEVTTNQAGEYTITRLFPDIPVELEVSAPFQPSAFYQTHLKSNKQGDPLLNYFPFRIQRHKPQDCLAIAPSWSNVSGIISFENTDIPPKSEALVHLKSLDGCSTFDTMAPTTDQRYLLSVRSIGAPGQLAVSFAGQPTAVFEVPVMYGNPQQFPKANEHNVSLSAPEAWPELNPVWTPGTIYAGSGVSKSDH